MNTPAPFSVILASADDEYRTRIGLRLNPLPGVRCLAECNSGQEAIAAVGRLNPDLLVVDNLMPGLTSFGCARRLQEQPNSPRITLLREAIDLAAVQAARRAGAWGLVHKPALFASLEVMIETVRAGKFYASVEMHTDEPEHQCFAEPDLLFPSYLTEHALNRWQAAGGQPDFWLDLAQTKAEFRVGKLGRYYGRSRSMLKEEWPRCFGCGPHWWLEQVQVALAKQLLRQGLSLAEVCSACHVAESNLRRKFRRHVHLTFREFIRGNQNLGQ